MQTVVIAARVSQELAERVRQLAQQRNVDKQDVIIAAVERELHEAGLPLDPAPLPSPAPQPA